MKNRRYFWLVLIAIAGVCVLAASPAIAAVPGNAQNDYNGVINAFKNAAQHWQGVLFSIGGRIFWYLAVMEFCWSNMVLALRGGDVSDFVNTNVKSLLGIGIFLAFLLYSFQWAQALVQMFFVAGQVAVAASGGVIPTGQVDPASVFSTGMQLAQLVLQAGASTINPFSIVLFGLIALIFVFLFGYLAALVAVAFVEVYVVAGGLVLMLGFGGSSWTNDIAKRSLMFVISSGAKLFTIYLIVGCSISVVSQWAQAYVNSNVSSSDSPTFLGLIGITFLVCVLAKQIPELVQAMLHGSPPSTGTAISTLAAAGAAAAALTSGGIAAAGAGGAGAAGAAGGGAGGAGVSEGILAASGQAAGPATALGMGVSALGHAAEGASATAASAGSTTWNQTAGLADMPGAATPGGAGAPAGEPAAAGAGSGVFRGRTAAGHLTDAVGHLGDMATGINPVQRAGGVGGVGMPRVGKGKGDKGEGDDASPAGSQAGGASGAPSAGVSEASAARNTDSPVSTQGGDSSTLDERAAQSGSTATDQGSFDQGGARAGFSDSSLPSSEQGPAAAAPSSAFTDAASQDAAPPAGSSLDEASLRVPTDPASQAADRALRADNRYEADQSAFDTAEETRLAREDAPKTTPPSSKK